MALKKISIRIKPQDSGKRLDQVLAELLPAQLAGVQISKSKVRKLIVAGAVYLNGKRVRIASKEILSNAWVEAYIDQARLFDDSTRNDQKFEMTENHILFEDEYLLAVNKPAGLPTQPTLDDARSNLFSCVKEFLIRRSGSQKTVPYLALHHRLDRDTSGVLILSKSMQANAGLAEEFSSRSAEKIYQALAQQTKQAPARWSVQNYLGKLSAGSKKNVYGAVRSGGDPAHTDFARLEDLGCAVWVEARPHTGRTHQIRVHLSEGGFPILGDTQYGGVSAVGPHRIAIPRTLLHACSLSLKHPVSGVRLRIESPLPQDFTDCLKKLR